MSIERVPGPGEFSYSNATAAAGEGRWVFVSGQVGFDTKGRIVEGGLREQAVACFDHISAALERFGGDLSNVVRITAYVTTLDDYPVYGQVRGEKFGTNLPASATVQVAGLLAEGALIEIDAVAFVEKVS